MPCSLQPWEIEIENNRAKQHFAGENERLKRVADSLTAELDRTRELALALLEGRKPDAKAVAALNKAQIAHRKEDLARLEKTLTEMLVKVKKASPNKPLEQQLGFNPDSI